MSIVHPPPGGVSPAATQPRKAGPQPANQIAATADEQLARVHTAGASPPRRDLEAEVAELRRQVAFLVRRVYSDARG